FLGRGQKPPASAWLGGIATSEYSQQDVLCGLQLKPSDMRWLTKMPQNPEQTDLVLFLGCYPYQHPDKIMASLDILEKLNLNFVALAGGPICCGFKHWFSGDFEKADAASQELVRALKAFKPKKVIFWCGTCHYIFKEEIPRIASLPFEIQHLSQLLCENLSEFEFTRTIRKTITIHDSCNLGHKAGDYTSMRKLLSSIPGVELAEMPHNRQNAICCGAGAVNHYPEIARQLRINRLEEAKNTGADIMAASCTGCHLLFALNEDEYPVEVKNYITVFAEALGLHHEDRLKKYLNLQDVDAIMESAQEYIDESPIPRDQTRNIVSRFFNRLWTMK
ncbi:(Fe-S)-binding protein, partial [Chloroflexota bacterium]